MFQQALAEASLVTRNSPPGPTRLAGPLSLPAVGNMKSMHRVMREYPTKQNFDALDLTTKNSTPTMHQPINSLQLRNISVNITMLLQQAVQDTATCKGTDAPVALLVLGMV